MRLTTLLVVLAASSGARAPTAASGSALPLESKYVLLDVPYTLPGNGQTYATPQGGKADPWLFSHALLTAVQIRPEFSEFRDAQGRILRVSTPDGQLRGIYPVT